MNESSFYNRDFNDLFLEQETLSDKVFESCVFKSCDFTESLFDACVFKCITAIPCLIPIGLDKWSKYSNISINYLVQLVFLGRFGHNQQAEEPHGLLLL